MKKIITQLLITILSFGVLSPLVAQTIVEASVKGDSFEVKDLLEVTVEVRNNRGLHGIYFEMDYDSTILQFESMVDGNLSNGFPVNGELLYAVNPNKEGNVASPHIIASYTLEGNNIETLNNGLLLKMYFRVLKQDTDPNKLFSFAFSDMGIIDSKGDLLTDTSWVDSNSFSIDSPYSGAKISINEPYYNKVLDKSDLIVEVDDDKNETLKARVKSTFTPGDFLVKIYNEKSKSSSVDFISNNLGYLEDFPVSVDYGFNTLVAELYSATEQLIAFSTSVVYIASDKQFIKITSPSDHAFINRDMSIIQVQTPYDNVSVNHMPAKLISTNGSLKTYEVYLWLKKGFNKIEAKAISPENVTYTDSIELYYRKNSQLFNLILPGADKTFQEDSKLIVRGEIGSQFRANDNSMGSLKNEVSIDVYYTSDDGLSGRTMLYKNIAASISESSFDFFHNKANYVFENDSPISFEDLRNGTLQIDVFKNREGLTFDDKLTRICYINNNKLSITLEQPNVFSRDILDTQDKLKVFDTLNENTSNFVSLNNRGEFQISSSELKAKLLTNMTGIVSLEEAPDGTLYALKNSPGSLSIWAKKPEEVDWSEIVVAPGLYGCILKYTDKGLFVGTSNLYSSTEDGLYLLEGGELKNIRLPQLMTQIQFLNFVGTKLYLYGNYFSHIYSFDVFQLEAQGSDLLVPGELSKDALSNNVNIKQFILTEDLSTAVIRDEVGSISFYKKSADSYNLVNMANLGDESLVRGKQVVYGNYSKGDYSTFLIYKLDGRCEVVMKNKNTHELSRYETNWSKLIGQNNFDFTYIDFKDDYFHFLYEVLGPLKTILYTERKGQIFFDSIYDLSDERNFGILEVDERTSHPEMFISSNNAYYFNFGNDRNGVSNTHNKAMATFYNKYVPSGDYAVHYRNEHIDGIRGFSFEVAPRWIDSDQIKIAFSLIVGENTVLPSLSLGSKTLKEFLNQENDHFTISSRFDAFSGNYIVLVQYDEVQGGDKSLKIDMILNSLGYSAPKLANLTVLKKIPVKLTINKEENGNQMILPIHGRVNDRTVSEVFIQNNAVALERDGSFFYPYMVETVQDTIAMNIHCENERGVKANLDFNILIIESKNAMEQLEFFETGDPLAIKLDPIGNVYKVQNDEIYASALFYGLEGTVLGYKIYDMASPDKASLLKAGLLKNDPSVVESEVYTLLGFTVDNRPGAGYRAGKIDKEKIDLVPGEQRLVIYCENPDGKIEELTTIVHYDMDESEQDIIFTSGMDLTVPETVSNIEVSKIIALSAYEEVSGNDYNFTRDFTLSGEVKTLYNTKLIVKSYTTGLTFANGQNQITIDLEAGNKFSVPLTFSMGDSIEKDFYIACIPDSILLTGVRKAVKIHASKFYNNTNFIPDFTEINGNNVETGDELPRIPVKLKFNRADIPVPRYTRATFYLNYQKNVQGWIVNDPDNAGYYTIVDDANQKMSINDLKPRVNRLSWTLDFKDPLDNSFKTMSSSTFDLVGMVDHFFNYSGLAKGEPTVITFAQSLKDQFYGSGLAGGGAPKLPDLKISRDPKTEFQLFLNKKEILLPEWTVQVVDKKVSITVNSQVSTILKQGRNILKMVYTEAYEEEETLSYSFLYDDKEPVVVVESYKYAADYKTLNEVSFYVTEANYSRANLYYGTNIHGGTPVLSILGADTYRLTWKNLNIDTDTFDVKAEILDLTGLKKSSFIVPPLNDLVQQGTETIREVDMDLPRFTAPTGPTGIPNEKNQVFPDHAKFSPEKFLKRLNVTQEIAVSNGVLIDNLEAQKLLATDGAASDRFGYSVSISGDYMVVGANGDDSSKGAAYVYHLKGRDWVEIQKLFATDGAMNDTFGYSVSISGDYLVVGAIGDDDKGSGSGSAYVYHLVDGVWVELPKMIASDGAGGDKFGYSVSISGDYLVVGATGDGDKGPSSGSAYVYHLVDGVWVEKSKITASDGAMYDLYGFEVSISGNYLVVGAPYKGSSSGSAYVYHLVDGVWVEMPKMTASDGAVNDFFGFSVSISGDYLVVGAVHDDDKGSDSGSAYVYHLVDGVWVVMPKMTASDGAASDKFGYSVSISGDYLVVGAVYDDDKGSNSGSAYVYHLVDEVWLELPKMTASDDTANDQFGRSVSISGDSLVFGAPYNDVKGYDSGSAYIYSFKREINKDSNKYMVFKVNANQILDFETEFKKSIKLQLYGSKVKKSDNTVSQIGPHDLSLYTISSPNTSKYTKYYKSASNYYFIVDVIELEREFLEMKNLYFPTDPGVDYSYLNSGSLRVVYTEDLKDNHPVEIYFTGDVTSSFDDLNFYNTAYEGIENVDYLNTAVINTGGNFTHKHEGQSEDLSFYFWLRPEEEGFGTEGNYADYYKDASVYNKVLSIPGYNLGYDKNEFKIFKEGTPTPIFTIANKLIPDWNFITLQISSDNSLKLYINNDEVTPPLILEAASVALILADQAEYSFAPTLGLDGGFYSIAEPMYFNRLLSDYEILRLFSLKNGYALTEQSYHFPDNSTEFGPLDYELRQDSGSSDYFESKENALATGVTGHGSLKASSFNQNLFVKHELDPGEIVLKMKGSSLYTRIGADIVGGVDSFTIKPTDGKGHFFFGNRTGNSGLKENHWYSVSGTVNSLEAGKHARLVLRVNQKEQYYDLEEGYFHFIYENYDNEIPDNVVIFIETTGDISLSHDLVFNEGNYALKKELEESSASSKFLFGRSGSIDFWYKPTRVSHMGVVNSSAVLFDSEYFRIETKSNDYSDAQYQVSLKNSLGVLQAPYVTNSKVSAGWQHLQLSYNFDKKILYFYLNGELIIFKENVLIDNFGSMKGHFPEDDNIYLGSDSDQSMFAEGYIDNFFISKYYSLSKYNDIKGDYKVYSTDYVEGQDKIVLDFSNPLINSSNATVSYDIFTIDRQLYDSGTFSEPFISTEKFTGGRYIIESVLSYNGHEYLYRDVFNINTRPKFSLKSHTPLIFSGNPSDLNFSFAYDRSYQFEREIRVFVGLAAKIYLNGSSESKIYYIAQDYIRQDKLSWIVGKDDGSGQILWSPLTADNGGLINLNISDIVSNSDVSAEFKYFYIDGEFDNTNKFDNSEPVNETFTIPTAHMESQIVRSNNIEYKIDFSLSSSDFAADLDPALLANIKIETVANLSGSADQIKKEFSLNRDGKQSLYYDDILWKEGTERTYGSYDCTLNLKYFGITILSKTMESQLNWQEIVEKRNESDTRDLAIEEFTLLSMDKTDDQSRASFVLKYRAQALGLVNAKMEFIDENEKNIGNMYLEELSPVADLNTKVFENMLIPEGKFRVKISLSADEFLKKRELSLVNQADAPLIAFTNSVDSKISYNNVYFSWKGTYNDKFNDKIEYSYQVDGKGWSEADASKREIRLYNLSEKYHSFEVKAIYDNRESSVASQTYFVDINRPVIDGDKIELLEYRTNENVLTSVQLIGSAGALSDISLRELYINGQSTTYNKETGSFVSEKITLTKDGENDILISCYDSVGNFTDLKIPVDNRITTIQFPDTSNPVLYSPMTIVGTIDENISAPMEIFLLDPFTPRSDDYSKWKKAKINEDRTFFIEDVLINGGAPNRQIVTTLKMVCRFKDGGEFVEFTKEINVRAKEITMPIEMNLSTHAAEGENEDTYVEISCKANVPNISSWSIDYNGDGIYDEIDLVKNPALDAAREHNWSHKYSSLQQFFPRVRVVTVDGNFFSVSDSLIIHEKIKDASPNLIKKPISMSSVKTKLETHKVFVLRQEASREVIDIYFIPRYDSHLLNTGETIDLKALNISDATKIRAITEDNLIVVSNKDGVGTVHQIIANSFGNYVVESSVQMGGVISDVTFNEKKLYLSFKHSDKFVTLDLNDGLMDPLSLKENYVEANYTRALGDNSHLVADDQGLLISDFNNQRVLRLNDDFKLLEQYGSFGDEGGEFLKASHISSFANRIAVYDKTRKDIQIFDSQFNEQATLEYKGIPGYSDYVDINFFKNIKDVQIIAKEEGDRLYYYALILSKSSKQLSFLRLPQYEELRARVRNNRIVFIKEGEVFTSKPDGSDIMRLLSTDSLPRIEGTLDYPAISPDGRKLVFTSRVKLYNSGYENNPQNENPFDYDNVYTVNIKTQELEKLDLGVINQYAIERPVFNSNGTEIIFSAKKSGQKWEIWVYKTEDKSVSRLFQSDENVRFPYYSPDDRFVVFTSDYDGDEDIEIVDRENLSMRIAVSANSSRDSLPVWNVVYPDEVSNPDWKVESKISFVSERNNHKGVYTVYMSRPDPSDLRVFNIKTKSEGGDLEDAPVEISNSEVEGDYPCFTGDGKNLFFEYFDGSKMSLKRFDFTNAVNMAEFLKVDPAFVYEDVEILYGARRPAGMKNTITNFKAENINGDEITLSWDRYTDSDIFYTVQLLEPDTTTGTKIIEKKVSSQNGTVLKGLKIGISYKVRVAIVENEKEVTFSQWREVEIPNVIARPTYKIDPTNPYVVQFEGWAPKGSNTKTWQYQWIIDNTPYDAGESKNFSFEFATSGVKIVQLRVDGSSSNEAETAISKAFKINIISDIVPVIKQTIAEDSSTIILDASDSLGEKIDLSSAMWTVAGPGQPPTQLMGMRQEFAIAAFEKRVYVTLTLNRIPVNGQSTSDKIEVSKVFDLDIKELLPVIDTKVSEANERVLIFDGSQSIGNINWANAQWAIFANGTTIHQVNGTSSFSYQFPETNGDTLYSVSLIAPSQRDGTTKTISKMLSIEAAPIEPIIEYKVIKIGELANGTYSTAKLVLDCTTSLGSNIDFSQAKWSLPLAGNYGDQPTQFGPTAVFSLNNVGKGVVLEVNLAMAHKGSGDYRSKNILITIDDEELPRSEVIVTTDDLDTGEGKTIELDIYKSTGGNINWENTSWNITIPGSGLTTLRGPKLQIPVGSLPTDSELLYDCTVYRHDGSSMSKSGRVPLKKQALYPRITFSRKSSSKERFYELSVLETEGVGIDWERTEWFIHDGSGNVINRRGSSIGHHFPDNSQQMGYPIFVKMYYKGHAFAFSEYKSLVIEGAVVEPVISYKIAPDDPNLYSFSALNSTGNNIKFSSTKWSFGDSSQPAYGATVDHKFPANSLGRTYRVTMTMSRVMFNGSSEETFSVTKEMKIGADRIRAVVKANVVDDFLILSASGSEGQGLLLDRSMWLFPGKGDSNSTSNQLESGSVTRQKGHFRVDAYVKGTAAISYGAGIGHAYGYVKAEAGVEVGGGYNASLDVITPNADYINRSDSFSSQNSHMGAVCRRSIGNEKYITVALTVLRAKADGGIETETVTVKIDINQARTSASGTGVIYGK